MIHACTNLRTAKLFQPRRNSHAFYGWTRAKRHKQTFKITSIVEITLHLQDKQDCTVTFFYQIFSKIRTGHWGSEESFRGVGPTTSNTSDTAPTAAVQIGAILRKVMGNSGQPELQFELKSSVKVTQRHWELEQPSRSEHGLPSSRERHSSRISPETWLQQNSPHRHREDIERRTWRGSSTTRADAGKIT